MRLFDVLGPVMIGPSSSHTAGAAKIGYTAQKLLGEVPAQADIGLYGSFATTGKGHGTDRALVAGLLGLRPDDPRLPDSFALAAQRGMQFSIHPVELRSAHPNTAVLTLTSRTGRQLSLKAASVGGGRIRVTEIDGVPADFGGDSNTLIIHNEDTPGCIAEVTMALALRRINIASMQVFRAAAGGYAVMVLECDSHIPHALERQLAVMPGLLKVTCLNVDEPEETEEGAMAFLSCEEMLAAARSQKITLAEAVLLSDLEESRLTEAHSRAAMRHLWQVMQATSQEYDPAQRSRSGLSGGDAAKVEQAWQQGRLLGDDYLAAVTAEALKTAECNACMKRIVAAPTAGSCGVLPAVLLPLARAGQADEDAVCDALYVAAGFGQVIAARATLAGAEGGCQAEVGAASAMAAAALCNLKGGTPEQCAAAAAMALGNLLGLVCDPVAGLVEVPCIKRNVVGAVNAVSCANMALAGVDYAIPCDEVIDAMGRVGSLLSPDLRETGQGGLAATPTGVKIARQLAQED